MSNMFCPPQHPSTHSSCRATLSKTLFCHFHPPCIANTTMHEGYQQLIFLYTTLILLQRLSKIHFLSTKPRKNLTRTSEHTLPPRSCSPSSENCPPTKICNFYLSLLWKEQVDVVIYNKNGYGLIWPNHRTLKVQMSGRDYRFITWPSGFAEPSQEFVNWRP